MIKFIKNLFIKLITSFNFILKKEKNIKVFVKQRRLRRKKLRDNDGLIESVVCKSFASSVEDYREKYKF